MSTDMLDTARRYVACGLSVIPIRRWSKLPDHQLLEQTTGQLVNYAASDPRAAWRRYTEQAPTDAELVRWFDGTDAGLGIVGGAVSGGLVRLDFEHPACLATWYSLLSDTTDRGLFADVSLLPVVKTGKGHHVYFRMADPPGHEILCASGEGDKLIVFSETQGEGCYCVAPPTRHYTDQVVEFGYQWVNGGPVVIPTLDAEIARQLMDAARFPGFWAPTFAAPWGTRAGMVNRHGLYLGTAKDDRWLYLDWQHVTALRAYLERYEGLLRAVETAPPPPSYSDDEGYDGE